MEFGVFGRQIWPIIGRSHRLRLAASVGDRAPDDRRSDEGTCFSFAKSDDDVGSPRAMREQVKTG
jgi:hypothetical protein